MRSDIAPEYYLGFSHVKDQEIGGNKIHPMNSHSTTLMWSCQVSRLGWVLGALGTLKDIYDVRVHMGTVQVGVQLCF